MCSLQTALPNCAPYWANRAVPTGTVVQADELSPRTRPEDARPREHLEAHGGRFGHTRESDHYQRAIVSTNRPYAFVAVAVGHAAAMQRLRGQRGWQGFSSRSPSKRSLMS